jgi:hypothetical protein
MRRLKGAQACAFFSSSFSQVEYADRTSCASAAGNIEILTKKRRTPLQTVAEVLPKPSSCKSKYCRLQRRTADSGIKTMVFFMFRTRGSNPSGGKATPTVIYAEIRATGLQKSRTSYFMRPKGP